VPLVSSTTLAIISDAVPKRCGAGRSNNKGDGFDDTTLPHHTPMPHKPALQRRDYYFFFQQTFQYA